MRYTAVLPQKPPDLISPRSPPVLAVIDNTMGNYGQRLCTSLSPSTQPLSIRQVEKSMDFHSWASRSGLGAGFHRVPQGSTGVRLLGKRAGAVPWPGRAFLTRFSSLQCKLWPRPTPRSPTEPRSEGLLRPLRPRFPTLAPCPRAPSGCRLARGLLSPPPLAPGGDPGETLQAPPGTGGSAGCRALTCAHKTFRT